MADLKAFGTTTKFQFVDGLLHITQEWWGETETERSAAATLASIDQKTVPDVLLGLDEQIKLHAMLAEKFSGPAG